MENELKLIAEDTWLTQVRHYVPSAWIGHAPFLRFLIRELRPRVFVELGTHNGFSYFVGCQTVQELGLPTKTYAVDHWLGDAHAGEFEESVYSSVLELNKQYSHFSKLLKMSFIEALPEIENESVDLLHIDGFHTYEAVKEDFETWIPKVSKNGVVIMHDIHVRHADFGVYKFWAEVKRQYKTIEFVGTYGLGVIFLGSIQSQSLAKLNLYTEEGQLSQIQGVFGCHSDAVLQHYRVVERAPLDYKIQTLELELSQQQPAINRLQSEMFALFNSKSWRLTKPLRGISKLFIRKV